METIFDILTMMIFAGLIVLFLQRSVGEAPAGDSMWKYLVAACGCAAANYLGNNAYIIPAVLLIVGTMMFIFYVLKPFAGWRQP